VPTLLARWRSPQLLRGGRGAENQCQAQRPWDPPITSLVAAWSELDLLELERSGLPQPELSQGETPLRALGCEKVESTQSLGDTNEWCYNFMDV
jgi:hypothetical protein